LSQRGVSAYLAQILLFLAVFAACLFAAAGRLDWAAGWILLGMNAAGQILTALILAARNPALMAERASQGKRDLDRRLAGIMALFGPAAIFIVAGFDFRFIWQPEIPLAPQIAGIVLAAAGSALTVWAITVNKFFYGVFRIAKDKGHAVCDAGPYRIVRHPGYVGAILFDLSAPLVLQSAWAFLPAVLTAAVIVIRTAREDLALQAGLEGYREYARRVRWRLFPPVW
jgi:protein-S-isoprenylcysteine O-methyltransferase Ste14